MRVFVDTSALYALLDEDDANHETAVRLFGSLQGSELSTHSYVVVEALALVSRRLGWQAVVSLLDGLLSVIEVVPVDAAVQSDSLAAYRAAGSAGVSFVDRTSFAFMRANRLSDAFAFDSHFDSAGFDRVG